MRIGTRRPLAPDLARTGIPAGASKHGYVAVSGFRDPLFQQDATECSPPAEPGRFLRRLAEKDST